MKKKNNKKLGLGLLALLLVAVTVGYAALSATLNINGTSTIKGQTWNVHFETVTETAGADLGTATIDKTNDQKVDFTANLVKPGDTYTFTVLVKNAGTIDAKVTDLTDTALSDAQGKYMTYTVEGIAKDDTIAAGASKTVTVTVGYNKDVANADLPTTDGTFTSVFALTFAQA